MTVQPNDPLARKELSAAKRLLLERRLRGELPRVVADGAIPTRTGAEPIPLSFGQEGIWFMHHLQPLGVAYNMHNVVRLLGPLDATVLTKSFQALVDRHEILRTVFIAEDGRPFQHVTPQASFDLPILDLSDRGELQHEEEINSTIAIEIRRPFDLDRGPLLRALLVRRADDNHVLVVTIHHIIFDDWSNGVFWRELSILYRAIAQRESPSLPDLPIQFADFALWQKQHLPTRMPSDLAYWKNKLDLDLTPLQLPTDKIRPPHLTFTGALKWQSVPEELCQRLKSLNQAFGATTFMTMLACFQLLLHRYTGQTDILVGYPMANRSRPETNGLIGLFLNTLVMRTNFAGDPRFDEVVHQVRASALEASAHQDLPFEKLVDELHVQRLEGYNPIFQVMFVHQKSALDEIDLPELVASEVTVDSSVAKFDLSLFVQESDRGLSIGAEFNVDLFHADTIDRILAHFLILLQKVVNDPRRRVSELDLLTSDTQTLLRAWNDTAVARAPHACIDHLIAEQAGQNPDGLAVIDPLGQLTYRDLDRRANQLAHYLLQLGVQRNTPVGLLLERTTDMIVAILGVLKAGCAYLPLDPTYPQERLAFMLADARAPVVLTHRKLTPPPTTYPLQIISIDDEWGAITVQSSELPVTDRSPENLVYIIYTSGSTGSPKGVPVAHHNLVHSTAARAHFYEQPVERFLLLSSFTFDSSVVGIFWTLCYGGTLVLPPHRIEQDMQQLSEIIAEQRITHMLALPSLHALLLEQADATRLATLRTMIVAGEECHLGLVRNHYTHLPHTTLFNEYGPTEATVWSTAFKIPADFVGARVPIGRPIPNMRNYILDRYGCPTPVGAPGELCIAGAGVTDGYWNRPELTAERFVEHSFAGEPPVRLYRTGDLARYLADGTIEYLGRIDNQVKIRGVRVEPGEVETVLNRHPAVHQSVVAVYMPAGQRDVAAQRLTAYVQPRRGWGLSASELRTIALSSLPEAMVPSAFILMDTLPVTPNGKIDRSRLPVIESAEQSELTFVAPRTDVEEKLAAIWGEVLGLNAVGIHDNFFDLGGDSILSIQIVAKAARQKIKLNPNDIFRSPTVAGLAVAATVFDAEPQTPPTVIDGFVHLTPIQSWFFEQNLHEPNHWNQSYLLQLTSETSLSLIEQSLQHLHAHHDALRLRFRRTAAGWLQEYGASERPMRVTHIDLSRLSTEQQQNAIADAVAHTQRDLDLAEGRLAAAVIFRLGAGNAPRLLLVIHHLAVDGVSWQLLLEDLEVAYSQLQAGCEVRLPRKTSSFLQWAQWLAAFAQTDEMKQEFEFWKTQASAGAFPFPLNHVAGDDQNLVGSTMTVSVELTPDETKALLQKVPATYQTQINDALLTALLRAFNEQTGISTLTLDLEGHGREALSDELDLSRTVGWFTTVSPLHLTLPVDATVGEALISVKEQLRRTPRKGFSYGLLRYLCQDFALRQQLTRHPDPQITFNYLGQFDQSLSGFSLFRAAPEPKGEERSPRGRRRYLLDINVMIEQGRLIAQWSFSRDCLQPSIIEGLACSFSDHLRSIITHCAAGIGGYTPSDFPLAELSQSQLDQIVQDAARHRQQAGVAHAARTIDAIYPLTPMQQLMLIHTLSHPNNTALFTQVRYTVVGRVDVEALRSSWQQIVDRHPALRTAFVWQRTTSPHQLVWRDAPLEFTLVDLRHRSSTEQDAEKARLIAADCAKGFDLMRPPLMRLILVRLADDVAELVWSSHHLVIDRWCIAILLRQMFVYYAGVLGISAPYPLEPVRPFSDYIRWLSQQDEKEAEIFWRQRLRGFNQPTLLAGMVSGLPVDPPQTTSESLSPASTQMLHAAARRQRLTINTLIQGAWSLLLGQYCQTDNVLFGVTVAGRPTQILGVESIVGSFINNLPVRVVINRAQNLSEWLQSLQTQQLEMQPYEHVSLAKIRGWSEVQSQMPLFDTLLIAQSPATVEADVGFRLTNAQGEMATVYPFTLTIFEEGAQLHVGATIGHNLIDGASAKAHLRTLTHLLDVLIDHLHLTVGEFLTSVAHDWPGAPTRTEKITPRTPATARRSPTAPARIDIERRLIALWESVLGVSPIGVGDDFFELGGSSLQAMQLFGQIKTEFGRDLPLSSLIPNATVEHLASQLSDNAADRRSVLVPIQPNGANPPFFCIHGLTGDVLWFRELGRCLAPDQPFYGIQARGLDGVTPPYDRIEPMAAYYVEQIRLFQPQGPYYLGGASLGGTIALEMAQQLLAQGEEVGLLVMFDHAPKAIMQNQHRSIGSWNHSARRTLANIPFWFDSFAQLGLRRMIARARRKLRNALKPIVRTVRPSADVHVNAAELLDYGAEMPPYRQKMIADHFLAAERYAPRAYPGRITLFQARTQPLFNAVDPCTGWKMLGAHELDFEIVAGSHEGMFQPPNVEGLAQRLQERIAQAIQTRQAKG